MNPLTALPAHVRKWIYVGYATLGIAFGATQVGFATAQADQPVWLLVAFGVFAYLGTALGLVAAANTQPVGEAQMEAIRRGVTLQTEAARAASEQIGRATASARRVDEKLRKVESAIQRQSEPPAE